MQTIQPGNLLMKVQLDRYRRGVTLATRGRDKGRDRAESDRGKRERGKRVSGGRERERHILDVKQDARDTDWVLKWAARQ